MPSPTPEQIKIVQTNLTNMLAMNAYIFSHGQAKILNAYLRLTETDDTDPGLDIALNILESGFSAIGSMAGAIGGFVSTFLSGMVADWATNTPPDLKGQFASYLTRFEATSRQIDLQLEKYYNDVPGNWNTSFTFHGQTATLSDLSTGEFPAEIISIANAALFSLDQRLWAQMLATNFVITLWEFSSGPIVFAGTPDNPPIDFANRLYEANPAYYVTWTWHDSTGCGDTTGWLINEYNVGTGAGLFSDGSLNNDACAYLFRDRTPGTIINPDGLFEREYLFTQLGIRQTTHILHSGGRERKLSRSYLRAMKEKRTLGLLIEAEGRAAIEDRILARAREDSVFAHNLARRPRQTLEDFLDVRIPEVISINVLVETPRSFAMVIPVAEGGPRL